MDQTWEPAASALGVVTDLPLPGAVQDLLASLRSPSLQEPRRSRRGSSAARPLVQDDELRSPGELDPATLTGLPPVGAVHRCGEDGQPLQPWWIGASRARVTPADVAAGRTPQQIAERHPALRLLLVPSGTDVAGLVRGEALQAGITQITWSFGPGGPPPPPETARRRLGGDSTLVDVRGHLVVVSCGAPAGTSLSWRARHDGAACSVTMRTPFSPLRAVQRLAQDTLLLAATAARR